MAEEITPIELAEAYLKQLHRPAAAEPFNALFVWEDLICREPERAWPVFIELLARANDDDTLEQISYRLELLLAYHWDAFHERVKALVRAHEHLPRFLPDEALARERFEPRVVTNNEIVESYLKHYRHSHNVERLEELIARQPLDAWPN